MADAYQNPETQEIWILDPVISLKVLRLDDDPEAASDWKLVSSEGPFSKEAMEFIQDSMSQMFDWEAFEPK